MSPYHGSQNPFKGKSSRIRMIKRILSQNGGRMKRGALGKLLKAQGYHCLIEKLEAMGFTVDIEGYVHGRG